MIYQIAKIAEFKFNPLESDFYRPTTPPPPLWNFLGLWPPHPLGISNSLRDGLWIFLGTTHFV